MGSTCTRTRIAAAEIHQKHQCGTGKNQKNSSSVYYCSETQANHHKKLVRPRRKVWRSGVKGFLIEKDHHGALSRGVSSPLFLSGGSCMRIVSPSALFLRFLDSNETRCPRALQIGSEYLSSGCRATINTLAGWMDGYIVSRLVKARGLPI